MRRRVRLSACTDTDLTCGAGRRTQLYTKDTAPVPDTTETGPRRRRRAPAPTTTSAPTETVDPSTMRAGWTLAYASAAHSLPDLNTLPDNTSARLCDAKGFSVSGVGYGGECSCGNAFVLHPTPGECAGDADLTRGVGGTPRTRRPSPTSRRSRTQCRDDRLGDQRQRSDTKATLQETSARM